MGSLEYAFAVRNGKGTRLSIEFLNWAAHHAVNRSIDGGFFSELWKGYDNSGICSEEALPYLPTFFPALVPTDSAIAEASQSRHSDLQLTWIKEWDPASGVSAAEVDQIKMTISNHWPVLGGFRWPRQPDWKDAVLQLCPVEDVFDGHSVILVGYEDGEEYAGGGRFIIRNSGGEGRDGYIPYAYAAEYMNDAAVIQCVGKNPLQTLASIG